MVSESRAREKDASAKGTGRDASSSASRVASSMMRAVHSSRHRARPFEQCAVGDLGDVPIEHVYSVGRAHEEIEAFASAALAAGVTPLAIGGDLSVPLPLLRAASAAHGAPLGLIHVDAHCDTWCEQWGVS